MGNEEKQRQQHLVNCDGHWFVVAVESLSSTSKSQLMRQVDNIRTGLTSVRLTASLLHKVLVKDQLTTENLSGAAVNDIKKNAFPLFHSCSDWTPLFDSANIVIVGPTTGSSCQAAYGKNKRSYVYNVHLSPISTSKGRHVFGVSPVSISNGGLSELMRTGKVGCALIRHRSVPVANFGTIRTPPSASDGTIYDEFIVFVWNTNTEWRFCFLSEPSASKIKKKDDQKSACAISTTTGNEKEQLPEDLLLRVFCDTNDYSCFSETYTDSYNVEQSKPNVSTHHFAFKASSFSIMIAAFSKDEVCVANNAQKKGTYAVLYVLVC